jgi:hypothetical protein
MGDVVSVQYVVDSSPRLTDCIAHMLCAGFEIIAFMSICQS